MKMEWGEITTAGDHMGTYNDMQGGLLGGSDIY